MDNDILSPLYPPPGYAFPVGVGLALVPVPLGRLDPGPGWRSPGVTRHLALRIFLQSLTEKQYYQL